MDAFLSTLPPYVHDFLNKHPPTDVFNLLRELICFAVLYSDDRDRINQATDEFLKKKEKIELESVEEESEEVEGSETVAESVDEDALVPIQDAIDLPKEQLKSTLPNTFPEWWGHHEFEPPKKVEQEVQVIQKQATKQEDDLPQSYGTSWISWEPTHTNMRRAEKARSQIIPDLRSYLEEDHSKMSAVKKSSSPTPTVTNPKRHSMINLKTSNSPLKKSANKLNETVTDSPVSTSPPKKLPAQKKQTPNPVKSTTAPSRSASVHITQPRQNAAMRARAEHARLQQEELERKKNTPPPGSSISLKIKQRVNSGIDWDTIKKERRRTIAEQPTTKK